jgi:hypothetical protein
MIRDSHCARRERIEKELLAEYGAVIGGSALSRLLGYRTGAAFRQAARRGRLVVPTFFIEGRRWRFAATSDVAGWMASLGGGSTSEP